MNISFACATVCGSSVRRPVLITRMRALTVEHLHSAAFSSVAKPYCILGDSCSQPEPSHFKYHLNRDLRSLTALPLVWFPAPLPTRELHRSSLLSLDGNANTKPRAGRS